MGPQAMWLYSEQLAEKVALILKPESKKSQLWNSKHREPGPEEGVSRRVGLEGVGHWKRNRCLDSLREQDKDWILRVGENITECLEVSGAINCSFMSEFFSICCIGSGL